MSKDVRAELAVALTAAFDAIEAKAAREAVERYRRDLRARVERKRDGFLNAEHEEADRKDWQMADRWRYIADGLGEAVALIDEGGTDA